MKEVSAMLNATHVQKDKTAAKEKATAVVLKLQEMKLKDNAL